MLCCYLLCFFTAVKNLQGIVLLDGSRLVMPEFTCVHLTSVVGCLADLHVLPSVYDDVLSLYLVDTVAEVFCLSLTALGLLMMTLLEFIPWGCEAWWSLAICWGSLLFPNCMSAVLQIFSLVV